MSEFIDCQEQTSGEETRQKVRRIISEWLERVPHHNVDGFGEEIVFKSIRLKPAYEFMIRSQYDKRELVHQTAPYIGEEIAPRKYDTPDQIEIWKYPCEEPDDFVESMGIYHVDGSDYVQTCYDCNGRGKNDCRRCNTHTYIVCTSCGGQPRKTCPTCGGSRVQNTSCYHCSGGYHYGANGNKTRCSHCGGTGRKQERCSTCGGSGIKTCSTCRGSGKIECPTCNGKGYTICSLCEGKGELRSYYEIHQELRHDTLSDIYFSTDLKEKFPLFTVDTEAEGLREVLNVSDTYYNVDEFDLPESIREKLADLLQQTKDERGAQEAFHQQQVTAWRYDMYEVDYEWNDGYQTMLVDESTGMVYDPEGPVYNRINELNEQAQELAEAKKYSKAIKLNSKAAEMDIAGYLTHVDELQDELGDKIMGSYRIGAWMANLPLMIAGYYFFMTFFTQPFFYLDYFNELLLSFERFDVVFAHHLGVLFVLLSLLILPYKLEESLEQRFGFYVTNNTLRVLLGFTGMIGASLYYFAMVILINLSGLTLLTGFASYGIYRVAQWLLQLI